MASSPSPTHQDYVGDELVLFQHANRWKSYFRGFFSKALQVGDVLEVGAGLGGTTAHLCDGSQNSWVCLEPDGELASQIDKKIIAGDLPPCCRTQVGILKDLPEEPTYDAILYVDVLEHIEDDKDEVLQASKRLKRGGAILSLSPAHNWLFSPFDKAIGHFRRYDKGLLKALTPEGVRLESLRYLDCVGVMASAANRFLMKQGMPTPDQIKTWDRWMVPVSRVLDPVTFYCLGKSIIAIWRKP